MANRSDDVKKNFPVRRVISLSILFAAILVLILALKKPATIAARQPAALVETHAASFESKLKDLTQPQNGGMLGGTEVRLTADEIAAAITKSNAAPEVNSEVAQGSAEDIPIGEPLISFEGDVVKGQFASEVGGKRVYVTVAGHLGAKDGYATFEPTEFKVGDLTVPVSLVNGALQKKMSEQKDRLKLPDYVGDLRVQNGELVIRPK